MKTTLYPCFSKWGCVDGIHPNSIWLYSDPHFADQEMQFIRKNYIGDEEQVKRINSRVGKHDTIIFLGDIGDVSWIKKVKGYKILIQGNHDVGASKYLRATYTENIACDKYLKTSPNDLHLEAVKLFPQDAAAQQQYVDNKLQEARSAAFAEYKSKSDFVTLSQDISYDFHAPFMYWTAYYDNKLFDEVYTGTVQINSKLMLSHEPVDYKYCFNIHGHDHSNWYKADNALNVCAEHIDYTPINLDAIIRSGKLKNVVDIHKETVENQTLKKLKKS